MDSDDDDSVSDRVDEETSSQKFPIKLLQPTIQKFINVLQIDLERLNRHKLNILKYKEVEEWKSLNKEHINSRRTVQQLKSNMREMERTRFRIRDEDIEIFDVKVKTIRNEAVLQVAEFLHVYQPEVVDDGDLIGPVSLPETRHTESLVAEDVSLLQLQQDKDIQDEMEQSWNQLQDDLLDLNGLMNDFSQVVHAQGEDINHIEDNVKVAHDNVSKGSIALAKAAKYKAAIYPVAGALIGGAIGGPVGLIAGLKIGVASAVGGSLIGFTGGRLLKKRQVKSVDVEMTKLHRTKSTSLPDDLDKIT